jgi:hypothetical protein
MFVPSGGGKGIIEAPYVMAAANAWKVHPVLQLLFHTPIVLLLCWLFARTLAYIPPH